MGNSRYWVMYFVVVVVWLMISNALSIAGISSRLLTIAGIVLFFVFMVVIAKRTVVDACPDGIVYEPSGSELPEYVDKVKLDQLTQNFEALGFTEHQDFRTALGINTQGFSRILIHPDHNCYGEIFQFSGKIKAPLCPSISTSMNDSYKFVSIAMTPNAAVWILRKPTFLWSFHPHFRVSELLDHHLKVRDVILNELGLRVSTDLSIDDFVRFDQESVRAQKDKLKHMPAIQLFWGLWARSVFPKYEWWGSDNLHKRMRSEKIS